MNNPAYTPTQWQGTLLYWALMGMAILGNLYSSTILPKVEFFVLALHILGFFAFLIPMVYVCSSQEAGHFEWHALTTGR